MNPTTTWTTALRHSDWLRKLAEELVGDPSVAQDLVLDACSILEAKGRESVRHPRAFLRAVLGNLARRYRRTQQRRDGRERTAVAEEALPSTVELAGQLEVQRLLIEEVEGLGEAARETILLRYYHGLSSAEIARRQGFAPATVRKRLERGLDELRRRLDRKYPDRRSWAVLVGAYAKVGGGQAIAVASPLLVPGVVMTMTMKVSVAAIAAVALVWWGVGMLGGEAPAPEAVSAIKPGLEGESVALRDSAATTEGVGSTRAEVEVAADPDAIPVENEPSLLLTIEEPDGTPFSGRTVLLVARRERVRGHDTDDAGHLRLPANGEEVSLVFTREAAAPHRVDLRLEPGSRTIRIPRGNVLEGYVVVDGAPPGKPVNLWLETDRPLFPDEELVERLDRCFDPNAYAETRTDDEGHFSFTGLPPEWSGALRFPFEYRVEEGDFDILSADRIHFAAPGRGHRIELHSNPLLTGRIVEADGTTPVAGARCTVSLHKGHEGIGMRLPVGRDGRFEWAIDDREIDEVVVEYARPDGTGNSTFTATPLLLARSTDLGDLRITASKAIEFRAVDPEGEPVGGAFATLGLGQPASAPTGADGLGRLDAVPGGVIELLVTAPGRRATRVRPDGNGVEPVTVVLEATNRLIVEFRTAEDAPLFDRFVEIALPAGTDGAQDWIAAQHLVHESLAGQHFYSTEDDAGNTIVGFRPDGTGRLEVQDLPPVVTGVRLKNPLLETAVEERIAPLEPAEQRHVTVVAPGDLYRLSGQVTDRFGAPLVKAVIRVRSESGAKGTAISDEFGRFAMGELHAGELRIEVEKLGFATEVIDHALGSGDVAVVLGGGFDVTVEVIDNLGEPVADGEIIARDLDHRRTWTATKIESGRWRLTDLPEGWVTIEVTSGTRRVTVEHASRDSVATIPLP